MSDHTQVGAVPSEFGRLAQLAFASRRTAPGTQAPRPLAFLPPEALDMDLTDPLQRDFGEYELLEKIGQGGMGVVYRARQCSLEREVALKLLAAGPWASGEFIARFRREAQSAARLEHPNIVTVFETGSLHDLHYFSMRLVRGESLAARLQREGPLPPREAARLLRVVADALDYAHRLGVLHLDLKPGNVLIDETGEPLIADFGLARRIDEALGDNSEDISGTPAYMAPEQAVARSQRIGRATDIYGLGAILYEMLVGRPPFLGATPQATLERVVTERVAPPREQVRSIPLDLDAICVKCLIKEPEQRYATAAALSDDLRRFLEDRPVSVREPGGLERARRALTREPRITAAVGAVVLALVIGLAVSTQQWSRAQENAATSRTLVWEGRRNTALRLEQEGRGYEALALLGENLREAEAARDLDTAALEQRRIGLLRGQGATLIDRFAIDDANPFALELSPDGERLAIAFNDLSVRWYDRATLREQGRVSLQGRLSSSGSARIPRLLRFAGPQHLRATLDWYENKINPHEGDTWLIDLDTASIVEPPSDFAEFSDASFTPDGRHALLRDRIGRVQYWQVSPWRALSAQRTDSTGDLLSWIFDPQGRYAVCFSIRQIKLEFFELPSLTPRHVVELPHYAGVYSWAWSRDGQTLALGDFEGRVFLFDVPSRVLRALPSARGREVTWLAFSEDDRWVASATYDGLVSVFDVASGDPLHAGQIRHDFVPRRLGLIKSQRLLIVAGEGQTALWRLALPGTRASAPQRVGLPPAPHGLAAYYATAWSSQTGLFVSAGLDGQVRLSRLPSSPLLAARAARQPADQLDFDGRRLPDVAWNQLRLIDPDGRALTQWRAYPQPPGFAELVDAGRVLLTTVGPQLHFEDAVTGRALAAPQHLPDSPQRLLATPDGGRVLLSFGAHGTAGFEERLRLFDTHNGAALPGEVGLPGPIRRFSFSADGERLLAVGPLEGATFVLRTENLQPLAEFPHDPYEPVQWADFAPDGTVLLALRTQDARTGSDKLLRWDPVKDEICGEAATPHAQPVGAIAIGDRGLVGGARHDVAVDAEGRTRTLARLARSEPNAILRLDPQGRLLARAHRHEVQMFDARTLEPLGMPRAADIPALDTIMRLAFSPDGEHLIAVSWQGYLLHWKIASDPRPATTLTEELTSLADDPRLLVLPSAAERQALRASDPGVWTPADPRPEMPVARLSLNQEPVPPRDPALPPEIIDLTDFYDVGPDALRNFFYNIRPSMRSLPVGRQRIAGVEYDLRGMVGVAIYEGARNYVHRVRNIPLAGQRAAALHMLLDVSLPEPRPSDVTLGRVVLRYADGSSAELPLRTGRELPGYAGDDADVPFAFAGNPTYSWTLRQDTPFSAPRLVNPYPERALKSLDLEQEGSGAPILLMGVTLEPAAVIATTESGSAQ